VTDVFDRFEPPDLGAPSFGSEDEYELSVTQSFDSFSWTKPYCREGRHGSLAG
jgi:hypothetical protein